MANTPLRVMVLAGGPDRERPVSLVSGQQVSEALASRGHDVRLRDILPGRLEALEEFVAWPGQVLFLALHGAWGEGGGLQRILDQRRLPYFGCGADAAALCMDKAATKARLRAAGLPTPEYEVLRRGESPTLKPPVVLKPLCEGSSIDVVVARTAEQTQAGLADLHTRHDDVLVERFVPGLELTCGVIGAPGGVPDEVLPPVQIIPATEFYDYAAKYLRDDTQYVFDLPLPAPVIAAVRGLALRAHQTCGCRHLSRVDFIIDQAGQPWILEINTIPGFTSHSLVPKAAAHLGLGFADLCDRLARIAIAGP